jgi:hypothetical protein
MEEFGVFPAEQHALAIGNTHNVRERESDCEHNHTDELENPEPSNSRNNAIAQVVFNNGDPDCVQAWTLRARFDFIDHNRANLCAEGSRFFGSIRATVSDGFDLHVEVQVGLFGIIQWQQNLVVTLAVGIIPGRRKNEREEEEEEEEKRKKIELTRSDYNSFHTKKFL